MKKILLLIASAAIALAVNAAPQKVDFGKLPKNSQEFIQKNFLCPACSSHLHPLI